MSAARTFLFVPGSRPDRFASAEASGADVVLIDLEDAVAPRDRPQARAATATWLREHRAAVRINSAASGEIEADLAALKGSAGLTAVLLAKAEGPDQVALASEELTVDVIALIETAIGVHRVTDIATHPATSRLAFGALDLAADLGSADSWEALHMARSALVLASRIGNLEPPIDGVSVRVDDLLGLRADLDRAIALGFRGKLCIHPRQIDTTHRAFVPNADEIAWARAVLARPDAVSTFEGELVDAPVLARARQLLARVPESIPVDQQKEDR